MRRSNSKKLSRVIIIDDEPSSYQLQPRNAIPIKPFENANDRSDTALLDLIPFLQAVATENVRDVPALLDEFRNSDGIVEDLPAKYAARVHNLMQQRREKETKGFGGMLRSRAGHAQVGGPAAWSSKRP